MKWLHPTRGPVRQVGWRWGTRYREFPFLYARTQGKTRKETKDTKIATSCIEHRPKATGTGRRLPEPLGLFEVW
jgi:hypothetical protein